MCNLSVAVEANTITTTGSERVRAQTRVAHYLAIAFQSTRPTAPVARLTLDTRYPLTIGRGPVQRIVPPEHEGLDGIGGLQLPDRRMSSRHAEIRCDHGTWFIRDLGSKNGTRVNGTPATHRVLRSGDVIELGNTVFVFRGVEIADDVTTEALRNENPSATPDAMTTLSPVLEAELERMRRIAPTRQAVLITGETGTGKELTARAIHEMSGRTGPLVCVNCASIPETLVESSFFGVKRGAFSGATEEREGWVRAANGGTLFLDEVAELSEQSQAALLRVLQEGEVVPVGCTKPIRVDVRIVSATHQNLTERIRDGRFREDVYARLAGHVVHLPALRERLEDMALLAGPALRHEEDAATELHRDATRALFNHPWPRNARELHNVLANALALAGDQPVDVEHLPSALRPAVEPNQPIVKVDIRDDDALRSCLVELYTEHCGNVSAVARTMGKARMQIQRWNKRFGINPRAFKPA